MHIEVERELHNLTLEAIIHGRCLAKEWLADECPSDRVRENPHSRGARPTS